MTRTIDKLLFTAAATFTDRQERDAFLDHACRNNPELRRQLEELLETQAAADNFFEFQPALVRSKDAIDGSEEEGLGTSIGQYRLIERIGAGGCGVVYMAEQHEPVRRKVALKIIRFGIETEDVIARFKLERQALAVMDHPNIARVLDVGPTASGRPYFVMELVDGQRITNFCDTHRFGIRRRLELFVQVCQAIQHAHQKGVIHRDIKPSNVLVGCHDGVPQPKIIDFGIAKATADSAHVNTAGTGGDKFLGTAAYMSPEQADGAADVDTRSDVYSLGALLYELLCGSAPFDLKRFKDSGADEIRRILRAEEPQPPSAALSRAEPQEAADISSHRGTESRRLSQLLTDELDSIVMKAIAKDPRQRYGTVNGLALDIQRYLNGEPVSARPANRGYILKKLIFRNKAVFAACGTVVCALAIGLGVSSLLFMREKAAREEQVRLRAVADLARASETALRQTAERGERLAQAAVKVSYGDLKGTDKLLAPIAVEDVPASLENANTLLALARWHLQEGRASQAAKYFNSGAMVRVTVDASDTYKVSNNMLRAAAAVCVSGDCEEYEKIRRRALERFAATSDPVVAEEVLKLSLIYPADDTMRQILGSLADKVERASKGSRSRDQIAWGYFALALKNYRFGDYSRAVEWANRGLANPAQDDSWLTITHIILAMAEQQSGNSEKARAWLTQTREPVRKTMAAKANFDRTIGWDWVFAGVLFTEASQLIDGTEAKSSLPIIRAIPNPA